MADAGARLGKAALDERTFDRRACDRLVAFIDIDDTVDPHTELPPTPRFLFPQEHLLDCFRLSRALWRMDVDRATLLALVGRIARSPHVDEADRRAFKNIRASFKHLRFAFGVYSARHRYPLVLDWITVEMGHLQDAFRQGRRNAVRRHAALLRLLLSAVPYRLMQREVDTLVPVTGAGFAHYLERQAVLLADVLAAPVLTGHSFHTTRKIVSRLVSFYAALEALHPSGDTFRTFRSLSAINGLMGAMHDDLVEKRDTGLSDYHRDTFALPPDIAGRLADLVRWYGGR